MQLTYELIKPIIVFEQEDNFNMIVHFKANNSPKVIESKATIARQYSNSGSQAKSIVRDTAVDGIHEMIRGIVRSVFGHGRAGLAGTRITERILHDNNRKLRMSGDDKKAAVVEAFRRVGDKFHYDQKNGRWQLREGLSDLSGNLVDQPLTEPYEKEVLARMLLEIANADGHISPEERELLQEHLPQSHRDLKDLSLGDSLSRIELQKTLPEKRESMFTLAAVMVFIDRDIDPAEKKLLITYAKHFGFPNSKVNELLKNARVFILERAIRIPNISRAELFSLADSIKLDRDTAEEVLVDMKRKHYM